MVDRAGRSPCLTHRTASFLPALLLALGGVAATASGRLQAEDSARGVKAEADPKADLKDLLPEHPKVATPAGPVLGDDLRAVPEVELQAAPAKTLRRDEVVKGMTHLINGIKQLDGKEEDGFIKALRGRRADLSGLPFALGDACRSKPERNHLFAAAVGRVQAALIRADWDGEGRARPRDEKKVAEAFWKEYDAECEREEATLRFGGREVPEAVPAARVAALMQILAPEPPALRLGLVKRLTALSHPEASRALARMAIFSPEGEVRQAAVAALKDRGDRDGTDVLLSGLRYPWPAVAQRAAESLVRLQRNDLLAQVLDALAAPDPQAPAWKKVDGEEVLVVRELVKVNHHRNCLLCHAPTDQDARDRRVLTLPVPIPNAAFTPRSRLYCGATPAVPAVRIDVTYLRQDFSVYQSVEDAKPWPEMQRFDFLVRERVLTAEAADAYRKKLDDDSTPGQPTPYQKAVLFALRGLTGADAGPDAEAWRDIVAALKP
jgi:hypothetical protein